MEEKHALQTKVFCIISNQRVFRSRSPSLFTRILNRTGINGAYVPFMVQENNIGKALESLSVLNIAGANITAPFKEKVLPYLDVLSEGANIIGAVNTIVCKDGGLKGYNTNAIGIMDALNDVKFEIAGKRALVIGTGGAARAVVFILNWLRAQSITITGRDREKTLRLAEHFGGSPMRLEALANVSLPVDLVINATSISSPDESEQLADFADNMNVDGCQMVFDLNYGARKNIWKKLAEKSDCRFMDGLSALAFQARRTFLLWTGRDVPQNEFVSALTE